MVCREASALSCGDGEILEYAVATAPSAWLVTATPTSTDVGSATDSEPITVHGALVESRHAAVTTLPCRVTRNHAGGPTAGPAVKATRLLRSDVAETPRPSPYSASQRSTHVHSTDQPTLES